MTSWQKVKLGDKDITTLIGDGLHGTPVYSKDGEYAFINGNNLISGYIVIKSDTKMVNLSEYLKYKKDLDYNTLFVSINGTLGNVAEYNNEKIILGKSACYLNISPAVEKKFIKYVLLSPLFQDYLQNNATGTTIKNVSLKQIRDYSFNLLQKKIAGVLANLGCAYIGIKDYQNAKKCILESISLDERIYVNYYNLAELCIMLGDIDNAINALRDYLCRENKPYITFADKEMWINKIEILPQNEKTNLLINMINNNLILKQK